jgi:ATP-dependent protease ClpP protease subunit
MIIIIFLLLFNFVKSIDIINIKGFINNDLYNKIYNQSLTNDKYLYIYIDSQGGSLFDAIDIIYLIKEFEKNKTVICIASVAYSSAFTIFQSCSNRYVLPNSILMQHEFDIIYSYDLNIVNNIIYYIRNIEAMRLNIKLNIYLEKVKNELWLLGHDIIYNNGADKLIDYWN